MDGLTEEELEEVYNWVDEIPLSRPKRNMARDFSDAGIDHHIPRAIRRDRQPLQP